MDRMWWLRFKLKLNRRKSPLNFILLYCKNKLFILILISSRAFCNVFAISLQWIFARICNSFYFSWSTALFLRVEVEVNNSRDQVFIQTWSSPYVSGIWTGFKIVFILSYIVNRINCRHCPELFIVTNTDDFDFVGGGGGASMAGKRTAVLFALHSLFHLIPTSRLYPGGIGNERGSCSAAQLMLFLKFSAFFSASNNYEIN